MAESKSAGLPLADAPTQNTLLRCEGYLSTKITAGKTLGRLNPQKYPSYAFKKCSASKAAAQPHGEFKPQGLAGEAKPQGLASDAADKDAIAQARGELARGELTNTAHHAATPQAQAALAADAIAAAPNAATDAAPPPDRGAQA